MLFSSFLFLYIFLPVVILLYFVLPVRCRNSLLLLASLLFYGLGEPNYLIVMLGVIVMNYIAGIAISNFEKQAKLIMVLTVAANVSVLVSYKYIGFIIENINVLVSSQFEIPEIALPIGISFYIFQSLSYVLDVYKRLVPVQKNLFRLALYISMFPQLVAGPIVRYKDFMKYIDNRKIDMDDVLYGTRRFIVGLGKKVIIANSMGEIADGVFKIGAGDISTPVAWLGAVAYSLQIFFDFSGYSDMAIGLGRIFGFKYMENFNFPYIASSITDFWRRWHISLSTWFKDYVYIPLGGSRCSSMRTSMNLLMVFFLTGIWHGASWSFVLWGVWHGAFLLVEKRWINLSSTSLFGHIYTLLIVICGWVIFRADTVTDAFNYIGIMFGVGASDFVSLGIQYYVHNKLLVAGLIGLILCYPWKFSIIAKDTDTVSITAVKDLVVLGILLASIMYLTVSSYNPFIYFRF